MGIHHRVFAVDIDFLWFDLDIFKRDTLLHIEGVFDDKLELADHGLLYGLLELDLEVLDIVKESEDLHSRYIEL